MTQITFFDKSKQKCKKLIQIKDIVNQKYPGLKKKCIAADINGKIVSLRKLVHKNIKIKFITIDQNESLPIIKSSCVFLFGIVIKRLWGDSKLGDFSFTKEGFFYDLEVNKSLKNTDLKKIEEKFFQLLKKKYYVKEKKVNYKYAYSQFLSSSEDYKIKLIKKYKKKKKKFLIFENNNHIEIFLNCNSFFVSDLSFCSFLKVHKVSGAYWKNNKKNKMLQRIHVIVWNNKYQFDQYLKNLLLYKQRDHRKIGKKLNFYHLEKKSPGMIFWHPRGFVIFKKLKSFIRKKLNSYGYEEVQTPLLMDKSIWKKSGHLENYKSAIFLTQSEDRVYCIKPMNCPGHIQIFKKRLQSYKDLPIRIAEFGICHRNEFSGALHGLMRIRSFTQDDAHIFCTKEQVRKEINNCIHMIYEIYRVFGFKEIFVKFSSRPKKSIGTQKAWDRAEKDLVYVLKKNNISFEHQKGEGAFYGPKIEFILKDSLERLWQCGTIQLDFHLPSRLNCFYINKYGKQESPILIHRAILGSIERFIGILIEEYKGRFPLWLSPVQIVVIGVSKKHSKYVNIIKNKLLKFNFRVILDIRNETIGFKIRFHSKFLIPYMIICGDKEIKDQTVTVRNNFGKTISFLNIKAFICQLKSTIKKELSNFGG